VAKCGVRTALSTSRCIAPTRELDISECEADGSGMDSKGNRFPPNRGFSRTQSTSVPRNVFLSVLGIALWPGSFLPPALALPSPELEFTLVEPTPSGLHLVWNAAPRQSYSVLVSSNLVDWKPASVGVTGKFIDPQTAGSSAKFFRVKENLNPNPLISLGKPTAGSPATFAGFPQSSGTMVDGIFRAYSTGWHGGYPTPESPAWVAINLGPGPTRVLLEFNCGGNPEYQAKEQEPDYGSPRNYAIYTSPDSTDGTDGSWMLAVSVSNNVYRTRSSSFNFTGMKWVKLSCTAALEDSVHGIVFDEIEVYDISIAYGLGRMPEDTWFFMGDSITAGWADRATDENDPAGSHLPDFAQLIQGGNADYFPSMIDGGIYYEKSSEGFERLPANLEANPDYFYWALSFGTNDSANNNSDTASFKGNMQAMITLLLANGRMPVIPHIPYAADGQHDFIPKFNAVIDELVAVNHVLAGPDLYTFFQANPDQLRPAPDRLHPNDAGIRSINRLWAEAMRHLYP
jgi:acyl-CoA thioesterase-1